MVALELDQTEALALREVCEEYLGDLRMEVAGTDRMEFRDELKAREAVLKRILERLPRA